MRRARFDSTRREGVGRRTIGRSVEPLESRDLLALVAVDLTPVAGQSLSNAVVATFNLGDVAGTIPNDFQAGIVWGDGSAPTQGSIERFGDVFDVLGSHTYNQPTPPGMPDTFTVNVSNISGTAPDNASANASATVSPAPVYLSGQSISATKGLPFTGTVATFSSNNPTLQAFNFSATINWGDATPSTPGTVSSNGFGGFNVQGTHTYATAQSTPYTTTITVNDLVGSSKVIAQTTTANGTATVPLPSPGFVTANQLVVAQAGTALPADTVVGSFTYSPPGDNSPIFASTINWGDGHTTKGTVAPQGTGYVVEGGNTYAAPGNYTITITVAEINITVADQFGYSTSFTSNATAIGPLITAHGKNLAITPGAAFSGAVATFTDTDPAAGITPPTALINWGDGHESAGTVYGPDDNGVFTVYGTNNYGPNPAGPYQVKVAITDPSGESGAANATAIVQASSKLDLIGTTFAVAPNYPFTGQVATFTVGNPVVMPPNVSATIDWGNGTVTGGTISNPSDGVYIVIGAYTYPATSPAGSYHVKVTVADPSGQFGSVVSTALMGTPVPAPPISAESVAVASTAVATTPQVLGASTDGQGHVYVLFQDDLSGLDLASLTDLADYSFPGSGANRPTQATIVAEPGRPAGVVAVELTVPARAKSKIRTIRIAGSGILDDAGHALGHDYQGAVTKATAHASSKAAVKVASHHPKPAAHRR